MMLQRQKDNLRTEEELEADRQAEPPEVFLYYGEKQTMLFPLVDNHVTILSRQINLELVSVNWAKQP